MYNSKQIPGRCYFVRKNLTWLLIAVMLIIFTLGGIIELKFHTNTPTPLRSTVPITVASSFSSVQEAWVLGAIHHAEMLGYTTPCGEIIIEVHYNLDKGRLAEAEWSTPGSPCYLRFLPWVVDEDNWLTVHLIIHEVAHLFTSPYETESHGPLFRRFEQQLSTPFGINLVYDGGEYASEIWYHGVCVLGC